MLLYTGISSIFTTNTHYNHMKKILSILFLSLVLSITSYAQINIGAGYVNQSLSEHNPHLLNGFYIGGGYSITIGKKVSVTPGFYYLRSQGGLNDTENLWLTRFKTTSGTTRYCFPFKYRILSFLLLFSDCSSPEGRQYLMS